VIVILKHGATEDEKGHIIERLRSLGYGANVSGVEQTVIGAIGMLDRDRGTLVEGLSALPYVERVVPVLKRYKLASLEFNPQRTTVRVGGVDIGGDTLAVMAGPCSVESREQLFISARAVRDAGATILRGGAFKPRTSPYEFQGAGEEALRLLAAARDEFGLAIVTEVLDTHDVELVARYADMLQIGARNMQNYSLLREVGRTRMPVLLKRGGMYPTIENWLLAAEYILSEGNSQVVLCERGLPPYGDNALRRNVLDLTAVPIVKSLSHLPVIVDPSHGTGKAELVEPLARAAVAVGADGLMIELHPQPEMALSDGPQSLDIPAFEAMMRDLAPIVAASGRRLIAGAEVPV